MALRRPAAHPRRHPGWRRSGDGSSWESLISEDALSPVARLPRAPRPHSAVEGGQLDDWLEHLGGLQSDLLTAAVHDRLPAFDHRTPSGRSWRQPGTPPFSRRSSSCGSSTQCESPLGSQESLRTGTLSSLGARGSWERAHIVQAPRKEKPQVKLKQPITPMFHKARATPKAQDGEVERHAGQSLSAQPPDHGPALANQRPENQRSPAKESDRPVSWQVVRRGWNTNRESASPGGAQSTEPPTGTGPDPDRKPPLMETTSLEALNCAALHPTGIQHALSADTIKSHAAFNRKSSVQPLRATAPLCTADRSIQTSSAATTLVPQHKAGFSSITISSRKVSRSASLPGSPSQPAGPPSPPPARQPADPNSRRVTVQHNATIVKVKEQRVMCGPASSPAAQSQGTDTVVHRRKATIIKVTERRESYRSPATRPEYRHSYTEGAYEGSGTWRHSQHSAGPLYGRPESNEMPRTAASHNNGGTAQRSTLRIFLSNPPPTAAPAPSGGPPEAEGPRRGWPRRPLSWYGTGPQEENVAPPPAPARKWSLGLPPRPGISTVSCTSGTRQSADAEDPCVTLIKAPDPHSHQTPEEVLALNAAAVIANIRLQRQRSKRKTQNGGSGTDSGASPHADTAADGRKSPDQNRRLPPAGFLSSHLDPGGSPAAVSLQEALQRSRPGFVARSQGRVRQLQRRTRERKGSGGGDGPARLSGRS